MAKSRKQKKQPYTPPTNWDTGPNTQAQQAGKVIEAADYIDPETGKRINPNGVKRARRLSVAAQYESRGLLTKRQANAAGVLLRAWEANQKGPPAIKKVQVDTSPKPDAAIAMMIDRVSAYHKIARLIAMQYRAYVLHVARDDRHIGSMAGYRRRVCMERLRKGLDDLADRLGT